MNHAILVEPECERLTVMRFVKHEGGFAVWIKDRVITGAEYREWQQTGNVPPGKNRQPHED